MQSAKRRSVASPAVSLSAQPPRAAGSRTACQVAARPAPALPWVQAIRPSGRVGGATCWAAAGETSDRTARNARQRMPVSLSEGVRLDRVGGTEEFTPRSNFGATSGESNMRLCTINSGGKPAVGVKMGDGKVIDLSKQMPRGPKSVVEILAGGKKLQADIAKACAKPKAGATVSEKSAKYLCPIPAPGKILCIGLNYRKHAEETGNPIPPYPVVFCRFDNTLTPHNGKMPVPSYSNQLDWEAELTIVIGKKCRNVPKEKALSVIGGYACFNDGSLR